MEGVRRIASEDGMGRIRRQRVPGISRQGGCTCRLLRALFRFQESARNTEQLVGYAKESSRLVERNPLEPVYIFYSLTDTPLFISLFIEYKNDHGQKEDSTARKHENTSSKRS